MQKLGHISLDAKFDKDQISKTLVRYLNNNMLPVNKKLPAHWNYIGYQHLQTPENLTPDWAIPYPNVKNFIASMVRIRSHALGIRDHRAAIAAFNFTGLEEISIYAIGT